jgi:hypothetical protein
MAAIDTTTNQTMVFRNTTTNRNQGVGVADSVTMDVDSFTFDDTTDGSPVGFNQGIEIASTKAISFASGDVTITHSTDTLTFAGATTGYEFNDGAMYLEELAASTLTNGANNQVQLYGASEEQALAQLYWRQGTHTPQNSREFTLLNSMRNCIVHSVQLTLADVRQAAVFWLSLVAALDAGPPADTFTISDGTTTETWTAVAGAPGAFQFDVGANWLSSLQNLATAISADSTLWDALFVSDPDWDNIHVGQNTGFIIIYRTTQSSAASLANDRIYASLSNTSRGRYVDFSGNADYRAIADGSRDAAIPSTDPGTRNFGYGAATSMFQGDLISTIMDGKLYQLDSFSNTWNLIADSSVGVGITGSGTTNRVPLWTGSSTMGNSSFQESSTHFLPVTGGAQDLGSSGTRWRDIYLSSVIYGSGSLTLNPAANADVIIQDGGSTWLTLDSSLNEIRFSSAASIDSTGSITLDAGTSADVIFQQNNSTWLEFDSSDNEIHFLDATPATISSTGNLIFNPPASNDVILQNGGTEWARFDSSANRLNFTNGAEVRSLGGHLNLDTAANFDIRFQQNNTNWIIFDSSLNEMRFLNAASIDSTGSITLDAGTASDVIFQQNNVTWLTFDSSADAIDFASPGTISGDSSITIDSGLGITLNAFLNNDVLIQDNGVTWVQFDSSAGDIILTGGKADPSLQSDSSLRLEASTTMFINTGSSLSFDANATGVFDFKDAGTAWLRFDNSGRRIQNPAGEVMWLDCSSDIALDCGGTSAIRIQDNGIIWAEFDGNDRVLKIDNTSYSNTKLASIFQTLGNSAGGGVADYSVHLINENSSLNTTASVRNLRLSNNGTGTLTGHWFARMFSGSPGTGGTFQYGITAEGTVSTFTGQHPVVYQSAAQGTTMASEIAPGMIVESTGVAWNKSSIQNGLPVVQRCTTQGSKKVFGVVAGSYEMANDLYLWEEFTSALNEIGCECEVLAQNLTWDGTTTVTADPGDDLSAIGVGESISLHSDGQFFIITAVDDVAKTITIDDGGNTIPTGSGANNSVWSELSTTLKYTTNSEYFKTYVNSIGDGQIWVTNFAGEPGNGDYIVSSTVTDDATGLGGYGEMQADDLTRSSTVAKLVEDPDWANAETFQFGAVTYKRVLAACHYTCGT